MAGLVLLNVLVVSVVLLGIKQLYDQNIREAESRSQNLALALDLSLSSEIEKIDLSLKTVVGELKRSRLDRGDAENHWRRVSVVLEQQKSLLPEVEGWSIADADGNVFLHYGDTRLQRFSVADRDYFTDLRNDSADRLLISRPLLSRATGEFVLVFGRRITLPNEKFAGIVLIALPMSYVNRAICNFDVGQRGTIALRDRNLAVMTQINTDQRGDVTLSGGDDLSITLLRRMSAGNSRATYTTDNAGDAVERVSSYRKLTPGDLYAIVTVSITDQLREWKSIVWRFLGILGVFLVIANGSAWVLYRLWQRQGRSTGLLKESNERLETSLRQLRERDNALVSAQEAGRLGTYVLDLDNGHWISSDMLDVIFGIETLPLHSIQDWQDLLHEDDRASMTHYFYGEVIGKRVDFDREYRIVRPSDGRTVWVRGLGKLEFAEDGHPTRMLGTIQDVTALKLAQQDLERMAYYDVLTGLANRVLLSDRMHQAISRCKRRNDELIAICHLDLDGFKSVNDRWGHDVGDSLLARVAERFKEAVRGNDTVARLGGDEFVVVFCDLKNIAGVENAVTRLMDCASRPYEINGIEMTSTVSVGITIYPLDAEDEPDALIRHADQAMYEAKRNGGNRSHFFDPESDKLLKERQGIHRQIADALRNNEFRLFYQPKVDLQTGSVTGVEALLRWQHPKRGLLPPGEFLPIIESTELTLPIGEWVLREALRQSRIWISTGINLVISVNVFALHLQRPDFPDRLRNILGEFPDIAPETIELEILETTALGDLAEINKKIERCTEQGVQFSLDDFGTGYSSLTYLRSLPVVTVKIDRSFVGDMLILPKDQALVEGLIAMAHSVQRSVVAEGVETIDHANALLQCGCDQAQGFGIGHPMPPDAIPDWLATWQTQGQFNLQQRDA
ncbi:PAS domain S-box-containing protein/diguanylate cyclase (GGDEF) domain-containing protein [Propionivibrio dicarboxylicus]|uniref:PAS domain S-box-containing protein/diguanylate cyclase (GGDEF) domain-containing protein n=1 Tax=Propionivibrio dicarboxylicus TaxID=83767 RepID=A0A1G8JJC2_9RHOO|nr:PAS domain S-box-containing protein/diguanylate cyclase (GGDEF) domain-containing protein [Propionivibrio dicarboxylicus]